jgi:hypothetical protein
MAEVVFILALYIILPLAVIKYRKVMPIEKRGGVYLIPGGKLGLYFCCLIVVVISVLALMINGTDYFVIGIAGIGTGPVAYLFFKWFYGGLHKTEPEKYPLNPKTKLAMGDLLRLSYYCIISGIAGIFGKYFLSWYEGEWGEEYYLEVNESGFFSNFEAMLNALLVGSIIVLVIGAVLFMIGRKMDRATAPSA